MRVRPIASFCLVNQEEDKGQLTRDPQHSEPWDCHRGLVSLKIVFHCFLLIAKATYLLGKILEKILKLNWKKNKVYS